MHTLFIFILLTVFFLSFGVQKNTYYSVNQNLVKETKFHCFPYLLCFLISGFFICFTNIGVDYPNYYRIINDLNWSNYNDFYTSETGFNFVVLSLKDIYAGNIDLVIFTLKLFTISITFISIFLLRNLIDLKYALLGYMLFLYLPSFYLLSQCLVASLIVFGVFLILKNVKWYYIIPYLILVAQLHDSIYLFVPVYLTFILLQRFQSNIARGLVCIIYICMALAATQIFNFAAENISDFHYNSYASNSFQGSGLFVLVYSIPLIFFANQFFKLSQNTTFQNLTFSFILSSITFLILSYHFTIIERMEIVLCPLYLIFVPYYMKVNSELKLEGYMPLSIMVAGYMLYRGYLIYAARTQALIDMYDYRFFVPF